MTMCRQARSMYFQEAYCAGVEAATELIPVKSSLHGHYIQISEISDVDSHHNVTVGQKILSLVRQMFVNLPVLGEIQTLLI